MLDNQIPSMKRIEPKLNISQMFKKLLNNSDEKKKNRKDEDDLVPTCFPCMKKKGLRLKKQSSWMPS